MRMSKKKLIIIILVGVVVIFGISMVQFFMGNQTVLNLSHTEYGLTQLDEPADGQEVAIIDTSEGIIKIALYREHAPNTVEYFVNLVESGFYDDNYFYNIEPTGGFFLFGTNKADGVVIGEDEVLAEGEAEVEGKFPQEYYDAEHAVNENEFSTELWPFKGSFLSVGLDYEGTGAFLCAVNTIEYTEEVKTAILEAEDEEGNPINPELAQAFFDNGGIPQYAGVFTVFAQTYEGMDVLEKISTMSLEDSDLKINKITIEKYQK